MSAKYKYKAASTKRVIIDLLLNQQKTDKVQHYVKMMINHYKYYVLKTKVDVTMKMSNESQYNKSNDSPK